MAIWSWKRIASPDLLLTTGLLPHLKCSRDFSGANDEEGQYDDAHGADRALEAADRLCGKRLRPLIPILLEAMERHGHLDLAPGVKTQLVNMSAATIDRALRDVKAGGRARRRRGVAGTALRQSDLPPAEWPRDYDSLDHDDPHPISGPAFVRKAGFFLDQGMPACPDPKARSIGVWLPRELCGRTSL